MDAYIPDALTILGAASTVAVTAWRAWLYQTQTKAETKRANEATARAEAAEAEVCRKDGALGELRRRVLEGEAKQSSINRVLRESDRVELPDDLACMSNAWVAMLEDVDRAR